MLKSLRQHARYFYVLFFIVILSFVFWGVGTQDQTTAAQPLVEIGDEIITVQDYWRAYDITIDLYRNIYNAAEFDPEKMGLKQQVLESLIEERLLLIAAEQAGLTVTDEELSRAIMSDPTFMRAGAFNRDVYVRTLELNRMTTNFYEAVKRNELLRGKMSMLIAASVDLSPADEVKLGAETELMRSLREAMLERKRNAAIISYLEGLKKKIPITVNADLIS